MTDTTEELTNQTLFSNQEPILQGGLNSAKEEETPEQLAAQKKRKTMLTIGGIGALVILVLICALILTMPKKVPTPIAVKPSPTPVVPASRTAFQVRLDELSADLDAADPSKANLYVPPVDLTLTLDPLPRN